MHTSVNRGILSVRMGLYEVSSGLYAIYLVFETRTFSRASLISAGRLLDEVDVHGPIGWPDRALSGQTLLT